MLMRELHRRQAEIDDARDRDACSNSDRVLEGSGVYH